MTKVNNIFHFAKHFFYGTLISRIFGMVRDIAMAFYFGSSPNIASFMVAYRFSNLFRRLFGEGTMNAGFIPHFETLQAEGKQQGYSFYRDLLFSLTFVLITLIAASELILSTLKPGINTKEIINYVMIMLIGLIFICLYALNAAFLNCHKKFFLPAIAPVIFNVVWIFAIFFVQRYQSDVQIIVLSIAIVVGYLSQFLLTHFQSLKIYKQNALKVKWYFPRLFSKHVRLMLKPLTYAIIGIGAMQINSAIDTIFAKIANPSGPAYLWYAIRLQQLPLALFSIAVSAAILPLLSKALQNKNLELFKESFYKGISLSFTLMLISTLGIFTLGDLVINLIYGRGDFTNSSIFNTFYCLLGYSVGLIPQTFVLIMANCLYAKKDYKTPAIISLATVAVNIALNSFFIFFLNMETFSVALATSLSSIFNAFLLTYFLKKEYLISILQYSFIKLSVVAVIACFITQAIKSIFFTSYVYPDYFLMQVFQFITMASIFFGSILIFAKLTKCKEILVLIKKTPSKKGY